MGTTNRQFKSLPKMPYIKPLAPHLSKKEQALHTKRLTSMDERNDALDAYTYAASTLSVDTSGIAFEGVYTDSTTSSTTNYYGRTIMGTRPSHEELLEDEKKNNAVLREQLSEARRAKEIFIKVLTNLHVMIQELDLGDLRITDPFQYRVKRNELDETFNKILFYMEKHNPDSLDTLVKTIANERMLAYFEERGLL